MHRSLLAASDHFYASGTFWLTALLVILTIALLLLGYMGLRSPVVKRRLLWSASSLLLAPGPKLAELGVTWRGQKVAYPAITTLTLVNDGKADIESSMFDAETPIALHFGTEIVEVLSVTHKLGGQLPILVDGSDTLLIEPVLIKAGQRVAISVLTSGPARVTMMESLINVKVSKGTLGQAPSLLSVYRWMMPAAVLIAFSELLYPPRHQLFSSKDSALATMVAAALLLAVAGLRLLQYFRAQFKRTRF